MQTTTEPLVTKYRIVNPTMPRVATVTDSCLNTTRKSGIVSQNQSLYTIWPRFWSGAMGLQKSYYAKRVARAQAHPASASLEQITTQNLPRPKDTE